MPTKRIGFVDHNLDNFHANVYLKLLRGELADRGFTVAGGTGAIATESRAWSEANDVPWFDSVKKTRRCRRLLHGPRTFESGDALATLQKGSAAW